MDILDAGLAQEAKAMVALAFRNGPIEDKVDLGFIFLRLSFSKPEEFIHVVDRVFHSRG